MGWAAVLAWCLCLSLAFGSTATALTLSTTSAADPKADLGRSVTGLKPVPHKHVRLSTATRHTVVPTRTAWPAAKAGTLRLAVPKHSATTGSKAVAAGTPVWAQAVAPRKGTYAGPTTLGVSIKSRSLSARLGVSGPVWSLAAASGGEATASGSGRVKVGLDYGAFSQAVGGNYASRLRLVELPACALTTPQLAKCRKQTPLTSLNDPKKTVVSAEVTLGVTSSVKNAAAMDNRRTGVGSAASAVYTGSVSESATAQTASTSGAASVIAATDSTGQEGGAGGNYASTLSSAGSWGQSGSSGDFTYTYEVESPAATTSLAPDASLSYDSGSVDGKTANTQAQSSWVGDGWTTQDSFVAQEFTPCSDSPEGSAGSVTTSDECYDGPVLTMSLNGSSTSIVYDKDTSTYKLSSDNGATVSKVTGSSNGSGTYDTSYWVITERDGSKYYFGRNELPGWASGNDTTNSVDSERVYAAHSSDPCYNSTATSSYCTMAYKWHLDYVTTATGAAMAYYYKQDTNYYGAHNGDSEVKYVRDSYLAHIDYGFTTATGPYGTVPDKIVYNTSVRCTSTSTNCGSAETSSNAAYYPDVPYDLVCASGATCSAYAPSFFSTVRLTSITTQQYSVSSSAYVTVDSYALTQTEPSTGDATSATLWLSSVQRTGSDTTAGGSTSSITMPAVKFTGSALENRVSTSTYPGLFRYRITAITNELGGITGVSYTLPTACSTSATPSSNTASCLPEYWTPSGYISPMLDWFNKYAVQEVLETDTTGGSAIKETDYSYSGAAWHYDDDENTKAKYRTYGQWRGYQQVTTTTGNGAGDAQTKQVDSYYQGMDGDWLSSTKTRSVPLTDSQGGSHTDSPQLAGQLLESTSYLGNGGGVDHSTITSYWISAATATRTRSGLPDLTANATATAEEWTRQRLTDKGSTTNWRYNETDTTYDATRSDDDFGLPTYTYTHTVPADTNYDRCTATTYAPANTSANLVGLVSGTEEDSVACSGFTEGTVTSVPSGLNTLGAPASVNRPDQVVSTTRTFYDDATFSTTFPQSAAPTMGLVTMTRKATDYGSGAFTWRTTAKNAYDSTYRRLASTINGNGNTTSTSYTVNSAYLTTGQTVTAPTVSGVAHTTSSTLDPERGLTLTSTDVNHVVTTVQYDALGRATSVWKNSRATTSLANLAYTYTLSSSALSGVVTNTLNDNSGYLTSVSIEDSLGRTRQTQTYTPQGGRLINDTLYDSRGWKAKKNTNYWDSTTTPTLALDSIPDTSVPIQDVYTYDGLGRQIYDISEKNGSIVSTSTTVYNGDATTVIPPAGGVTKTTSTDPLGRTSELDEYTAAPTLTTPLNTATGIFYLTGGTASATTYGYDGHNQQSTTTDVKNQVWTNTYDLAGEVVSKTDPTAGKTSAMTYDGDGNLLQAQDSRGQYVSYTYDALDRKTGQYAAATADQVAYASTASPGNQTASWVYDNSNTAISGMTYPVGHVTTATSYSGGYAYIQQAVNFNVFGKSLGEETIIPPAAQGSVLGKTWKITHSYTSVNGLLWTDGYALGGGLPAEVVTHGYNNDDEADGLATTAYSYVQGTAYSAYNQVAQVQLGSASSYALVTDGYDAHTGELNDQLVTRSTSTPASVDETAYKYDLSGNITRQTETRSGSSSTAETQCYTYDTLDRLTTAWTATDACSATPSSSDHSTVGDGISGGTYWTSWTYDEIGNRLTQTQHTVSGSGSDTVTNSVWSGKPNTLTGTTTTGGTTGSTSYSYDDAGNTHTRSTSTGDQTLTWNNAEQLTNVSNSTTGTATSYIYDADGSLLLQVDPSTTTLYLGSEQITLNDSAGTATGVRYYTAPGGATIVRTGTGTSYGFELAADQHGTNSLSLDYTAQTPTWRQFDPYGNSRGTTTTWADNRTFLNKTTDTTTGLTDIGAREYDPTIGRFISLDPLFNATSTQELGGYTYGGGNPISFSDPSGEGLACGKEYGISCGNGNVTHADGSLSKNGNPTGGGVDPGYGKPISSGTTHKSSTGTAHTSSSTAQGCVYAMGMNYGCQAQTVSKTVIPKVVDCAAGNTLCGARNTLFAFAMLSGMIGGSMGDLGAISGRLGMEEEMCSFAPSTRVLMAGGNTKPISKIKVGDKVQAASPKTGKHQGSRTVQRIWINHDHDLLDLSIRTKDGHTATLHTTVNHPFWDDTTHSWVPANGVRPGDALATATNGHVSVVAFKTTVGAANRWNLTVQQLHTYYVLAGQTPVLVHNCDTATVGRWMSEDEYQAMSDTGKVQAGSGGTSTYVAHPANSDAYRKQAAPGSIYAEFDVPCSCLKPAGEPGWAQIPGPQHPIYAKLNARRGLPPPEMPSFENLRIVDRK
ncbi:RHS repeat-associated core domain-containing protein [Streptomyces sp. NPDC101234]|uniref:TreTu family toxin n=1 Tax=Streptomyces sp. NPDC101234 TaxID=3366138 RepID=UPI0038178F28